MTTTTRLLRGTLYVEAPVPWTDDPDAPPPPSWAETLQDLVRDAVWKHLNCSRHDVTVEVTDAVLDEPDPRLQRKRTQPMPPAREIHHIDGDPRNNEIANLTLRRKE